MKEYRLSFFILGLLLFLVIFNSVGQGTGEEKTSVKDVEVSRLFFSSEKTDNKKAVYNKSNHSLEIDIPLPLSTVPEQMLVRKAYVVSYNKDTRCPNWVAWHLTGEHAYGDGKRPGNAFHEDLDVPAPRANTSDYKKSGWTRGHMCPAGDNKWDADVMYESFLMTNMCPQHANLNSGDWNEIEMACREWAVKYKDIYIVCGPIYLRKEHEVIGQNKVVVPEAFFKVVLCLNGKPKGIGFICRNTAGNRTIDKYVNSIKEVERVTGINFFPHLSPEVATVAEGEANLNDW